MLTHSTDFAEVRRNFDEIRERGRLLLRHMYGVVILSNAVTATVVLLIVRHC